MLTTSVLLAFYVPVRDYLHGPYVEDGFPDLRTFVEFSWVVTIFGPLHIVYLLMLAGRHLMKPGRERRKAVPTDS